MYSILNCSVATFESGDGSAEAILDCLHEHTRIPVPDVRELAQRGLILLVFDGFDELPSAAQDRSLQSGQLPLAAQGRFLRSLQHFLSHYRGNEPFILTSREPLSDVEAAHLDSSSRSVAVIAFQQWTDYSNTSSGITAGAVINRRVAPMHYGRRSIPPRRRYPGSGNC